MFDTLLIANRGEIACRIIETAKRLGIYTIAIYADPDHRAKHVFLADASYHLPGTKLSETYLNQERILAIARELEVKAIHPGYGFLSENAAFAEAVTQAGIVFIGPTAESIATMGDKIKARSVVTDLGIPLIPSMNITDGSEASLLQQANRIGYPLLLKAAAGGGGKGMRRVAAKEELLPCFQAATREAESAFGDGRLYMERYFAESRHIEVQIACDLYGNIVHLHERDCSVQRRYQKVIEEAPALGLFPETREKLIHYAKTIAKKIQYRNLGTVEFLIDDAQNIYFLEMNTRLQVEHPVTEMIHGLDLVEWQLLIASGQPLPLEQEAILCSGHAIEVRLYAEDPLSNFTPQTGTIRYYETPPHSQHVRIDSGIRLGDAVSLYYDPLLLKHIVWGNHRIDAIQRLRAAMNRLTVLGIQTNRDFLRDLTYLEDYTLGVVDTQWIERHSEELFARCPFISHEIFVFAALFFTVKQSIPFAGFQSHLPSTILYHFIDNERRVEVSVDSYHQPWRLCIHDYCFEGHGSINADGDLVATLNGKRVVVKVVYENNRIDLMHQGQHYVFYREALLPPVEAIEEEAHPMLEAPLPGIVTEIAIPPKTQVKKGDLLLCLEAMKMQHQVRAPFDGYVASIHVSLGQQVPLGARLLDFERTETA